MPDGAEVQDRFVTLNGLRFHYREWGARGTQPLLLLHGVTGHARDWDAVAGALAGRFHVLALDLRGHGETGWAPVYSYDLFVADVVAFATQLRLEQVTLFGHSMGSQVAYLHAARHPSRLERLVLVDRGPGSMPEKAVEALRPQIRARAAEVFDDPREPIEAAAAAVQPSALTETRLRVAYNLVQAADGRWRWRYDASGIADCLMPTVAEEWSFLPQIRCPTLVVRGADSPILSRESAAQMERAIPDCRLAEVPESGHGVYTDNLAGFMAVVWPFLLSNSPGEERTRPGVAEA